jgi:flavin reductase (DIM6/NTAB) family NADH-FMN oxidoreductase RutF
VPADIDDLFRKAMASLASGVAVLTAAREDGGPCGLVATSLAAYSAVPPSVLISIGHASRCYHALADGEDFGVHLLRAGQEDLAATFANASVPDKFAGIEWSWDRDVPKLAPGVSVAYLHCRRAARFDLYDHTILIGDVVGGEHYGGEPLVYLERRIGWRLSAG